MAEQQQTLSNEEDVVDFEDPNTFIDISDALNSRQYVHRAILNTAIKHTSSFSFERVYLSHMMGFSAVWQRLKPHVKYITGLQGVSGGYITSGGHGVELGLEFSAVSNANLMYKYVLQTDAFYSVWPYAGLGAGMEVLSMKLANGPPESERYAGTKLMGNFIMGFLIPLVDVGFKVEVRATFYSMDRVVFTQGSGAVIFR